MKTVRQIADEIGVSRQAIQKRLAKEPLKTDIFPFIKIIDGIKYIDHIGELLLKSAYGNHATTDNQTTVNGKKSEIVDNQIPFLTTQSDNHPTKKSSINRDNYSKTTATDNRATTQPSVFTDGYNKILELLSEDISVLKGQLIAKDNQLEAKDNQIKELTAIIKTQAESIAAAQQTTRAEQLLHADTKGLLSSGTDPAEPNEPKPEKKEGFFKKMFGKNK